MHPSALIVTMPNPTHNTPLSSHFLKPHIWWDIAVLSLIWAVALFIDETLLWFGSIPIKLIFKIIGLIALLELFSFVVFHWLGKLRGVLLQGFFGGFISSTAVFIQLTQVDKIKIIPALTLTRALLLAILAMLIECLMIVHTIAPDAVRWRYSLPLLVQGLCIGASILLLPRIKASEDTNTQLSGILDHPIIWWKVVRFSALIISLMLSIRWLSTYAQLPLVVSSFFLSLFEAHAVLAAAMIEVTQTNSVAIGLQLIVAIIAGNTISKALMVLRTRNRRLITRMSIILTSSVVAAFIVFLYL